jgi:hypothetical protein
VIEDTGLLLSPALMLSLTGSGAACKLTSEPGVNTSPATGLVTGAAAGGTLAA